MKKKVIAENVFSVENKEETKIYKVVSKYYAKLLARCPLHKYQENLNPNLYQQNIFKAFVKIDLARDNLNRAIRLKPIKNPLNNSSIVKGISYVRQFFLKRFMILTLAKQQLKNRPFLIQDKCNETILTKVLRKIHIKHQVHQSISEEENKVLCRISSNNLQENIISPSRKDNLIGGVTEQIACSAEAEIIKNNYSLFGELAILKREIIFFTKEKDTNNPAYRLGTPKEMSLGIHKKYIWKYCNIQRIIKRQYNMIWQAIEILLSNQKSVFLVFFSEERLDDFFIKLRKNIFANKKSLYPIEIIDNPKKEFISKRYTEEWKRKRLSNYEYLIRINDLASRTFEDLSQYPVFPWILQSYKEKEISLDGNIYRDLRYPIAGISEKKRIDAKTKYDNTDDFPGGRFQYGSHYLPGRAVLGYLMRLQPYTLMIYRFDSGGDCPSRHFHILESRWQCILDECGNNIELIPEFYYNPEILANK